MKLTNQTAFNQVAEHLIKQGRKASSSSRPCMYRLKLEDGTILRCAIGCLIPDNLYEEKFEGLVIGRLLVENKVDKLEKLFEGIDSLLLEDLQTTHDYAGHSESSTVEDFKERLLRVAKGFELELPTCLQ